MTVKEALREEVRKYIDNADEKSLRIVRAILEIEQEEDWWDTMPEDVQQSVKQSLKEAKQNKTIPHEQVIKEHKKWFKK